MQAVQLMSYLDSTIFSTAIVLSNGLFALGCLVMAGLAAFGVIAFNRIRSGQVALRKDIQETLGKTEQKLALHLKQTPMAVIEWNNQREVTAWNPAAESLFGYSEAEILGKSFN